MISDFQFVLIGMIAVVIVAVIVYNRWQESKYRRRAERAFAHGSSAGADALFANVADQAGVGSSRVEPTFGRAGAFDDQSALDDLTAPIGADESIGQVFADGYAGNAGAGTSSEMAPAINAEIDTVAMILADAPVEADRYAPMIAQSQKIARNILWEGLVGGLWQPVDPTLDEKYSELRAGLQLADRGGAIDPAILQNFDEAMTGFATDIHAVSQREPVQEALRRAQMIDAFCAESDIEIAINIIGKSGATFAATKVRGLAESQGLVPLASGEFAKKDDVGRVLFTVRNGNSAESPSLRTDQPYLTHLSFALDVPRTPRVGQVFEQMFTLSLKFADVLHGEVVDDNKKVLTTHGRKLIADTIHGVTGDMQQKGIPPGSSIALRLYA